MPNQRMTEDEFEACRNRLASLSMNAVNLAHLVWVQGLSQAAAAEQLEISRQNAHGILKRATAHLNSLPGDWEKVEEWMPKDLAKEVRARIKDAKLELGLSSAS
ncbi:TrfB-related DNA-binding protein [Pseudomonas syringae]|uniref:TrfB-related DNA-binding protein n=1 Tax=Pseudomonas syringae TaxID=317 RepID=UPI002466CAAB|nr:TrfB-related DNA-binding protein [Pseudomonas syringae]MDH4602358.1 hypothetical protein [Pseudomonas syringae pv. papulans]